MNLQERLITMCSNDYSPSPGDMVLFAFSLARLNNNLKSEQVIHIKIHIPNTLYTFQSPWAHKKEECFTGKSTQNWKQFS